MMATDYAKPEEREKTQIVLPWHFRGVWNRALILSNRQAEVSQGIGGAPLAHTRTSLRVRSKDHGKKVPQES